MMIATRFATSSRGGIVTMISSDALISAGSERSSDLHDFGFLVLQELVDRLRVRVGQPLHLLLGAALVVVADVAVADELLEMPQRVPPDLADRDTMLLRHVTDDLHQLLAPLLRELR